MANFLIFFAFILGLTIAQFIQLDFIAYLSLLFLSLFAWLGLEYSILETEMEKERQKTKN